MPGAERMELNYQNNVNDKKESVKTPEELMKELIEYLEQHPELEEVYAEEKKKHPFGLIL